MKVVINESDEYRSFYIGKNKQAKIVKDGEDYVLKIYDDTGLIADKVLDNFKDLQKLSPDDFEIKIRDIAHNIIANQKLDENDKLYYDINDISLLISKVAEELTEDLSNELKALLIPLNEIKMKADKLK